MSYTIRRHTGVAAINPLAYLQRYIAAARPGGINVAWYDPADKATLFQDAAETLPVTASGQSVARMRDKFGGNHMTFDAGQRPVYTEAGGLAYLDGSAGTCAGYTSAVDLSAYTSAVMCAGMSKLSDAAIGRVLEFGNAPTVDAGCLSVGAPGAVSANFQFYARGATAGASVFVTAQPAPKTGVVTGEVDFTADLLKLRFNGIDRETATPGLGGGTLGNEALYLFSRNNGASAPFLGHFHGAIFRVGSTPTALRNAFEAYQSLRTGVF